MAACSAKLIAVSWATCLKEQLQVIITIQKLVGNTNSAERDSEAKVSAEQEIKQLNLH